MARLALTLSLVSMLGAAGWEAVGGNSQHNGLVEDRSGPQTGTIRWTAWSPPTTIGMQVYTWEDYCVVGRFDFGTNTIRVACNDLLTGDTFWTRNYSGNGKYLPFGCRDGHAYVRNFKETGHDSVFCIDLATGDIVWRSPYTVDLGIIWSATYAPNGDLLVPGSDFRILRLNQLTGDTVWTCHRLIPNTGAEGMCVWGDYLFGWRGAINTPKRIVAVELVSGRIVDSSAALAGDGDQELPFSIGRDGTIFCQRDGGTLHALAYTDSGFVELWNQPSGGGVSMNFGVGPDSTLYVPRGPRLFRLQAGTGAVLDSSLPLVPDSTLWPRVSIDREGFVYVATGTYSGGGVWCLTRELDSVWFAPLSSTYYTGPALGKDGITVIAGPGTLLTAYQPVSDIAESPRNADSPGLRASPNPFRALTRISRTPAGGRRPVTVFDASGREVRRFESESSELVWNGQDQSGRTVPAGIYLVKSGSKMLRLVRSR